MKYYEENLVVDRTVWASMLMDNTSDESWKNCEIGRMVLQEEDMSFEDLQSQVYEYGSRLKAKDYEGRSIFVCLVSMLRQIEMKLSLAG